MIRISVAIRNGHTTVVRGTFTDFFHFRVPTVFSPLEGPVSVCLLLADSRMVKNLPLELACTHGQIEIVRQFLQDGFQKASAMAQHHGHMGIYRVLRLKTPDA